jgi:hypothetical protein
MAQLDQALGDKQFRGDERAKLYARCVADRGAIFQKQAAECKLEALETPMVAVGGLAMILAENRRTQIYNACIEARQ